ncbi:hypothetical protein ACG2F4_08785 [Halalkalibaculum sp. DA3122]|uniref:hypothetical protein n=1 Tax=unclassified Halalkalibaculum TaxID=2964617 RepID=UPI0037541A2C
MKYSLHALPVWLTGLLLLVAGCKQSLVISDVNYAQPIESVLTPDEEGTVVDVQHGLSFNILPLQFAETGDSSAVATRQVRLIRGKQGFYYITAPGYSNVYVMAPEKHKLTLKREINIDEEGIEEPAFNQREAYVQLLDRKTSESYRLTEQGILENDNELASREEN